MHIKYNLIICSAHCKCCVTNGMHIINTFLFQNLSTDSIVEMVVSPDDAETANHLEIKILSDEL